MTTLACSRLLARWFVLAALVLAASSARAIDINLVFDTPADKFPAYDPTGSKLEAISYAAADIWKDLLPYSGNAYSVGIHWEPFPAGSTQLAVYNDFDHTIRVRSNNAWFLDSTPGESGEFFPFTQTLYRDLSFGQQNTFNNAAPPDLLETGYTANAVDGGVADGVTDLLSVMVHEMGHFTEIGWNALKPDVTIQAKFIGNNFGVTAQREDESHISPDNAALDPFIPQSQRILPSALDVIVAANEQNHSQIRLRRVDWIGDAGLPGANFWSIPTGWVGGREPSLGTEVTIRDQQDVLVLSGAAQARTVLLVEDSNLGVQDQLHVDLDAQVQGSGGYDNPKITVTGASGKLKVDRNLDVNLGTVELDGGTAEVGGLLILAGEVSGSGYINRGQLKGHGTVTIGSSLRNRAHIFGDGGTLVINADPGAKFDLDGNQEAAFVGKVWALDGNLEFNGPLNDVFNGWATVASGHSIRFTDEWTFGTGSYLTFDDHGALAEFFSTVPTSHVTFDGGHVSLEPDGLARVRAGVITIKPGSEVFVPTGAILGFNGGIEYYGGEYTGGGTIRQNGFAAVVANTTIDVSHYDWDGFNLPTAAETDIEPSVTFKLNVDSLADGSYDGRTSLGDHAVLDVNILTGFGVWQLGPEGTIRFYDNGRLKGSPVIVRGTIEALAGTNHVDAGSTLTASSVVQIADKATLIFHDPVGLGGGVITTKTGLVDDSHLSLDTSANVLGHHRVTVGYFNWDPSEETDSHTVIQPGAFLDVVAKQVGNGLTDPFLILFWRRGFGDVVDINSGMLGIQVGYESRDGSFPDYWTLNKSGRMNLNWVEHSLPTVRGSKLINFGLISGTGEFLNELQNDGEMAVGHAGSIGFIHLKNAFAQTDEGVMSFELDGLVPTTEHDQIDHTLSMHLDGDLQVTLIGGFTPNSGDVFRIITGDPDAPLTGTFASTHLPPGDWDVVYGPFFVDLRYNSVPEPTTLGLAVLGVTMFVARRRGFRIRR